MSNKAILEMDAPGRCYQCPLCHGNGYTGYRCAVSFSKLSGIARKVKEWESKRAPFCPLQIVEHGEYPVVIQMNKIRRNVCSTCDRDLYRRTVSSAGRLSVGSLVRITYVSFPYFAPIETDRHLSSGEKGAC